MPSEISVLFSPTKNKNKMLIHHYPEYK